VKNTDAKNSNAVT